MTRDPSLNDLLRHSAALQARLRETIHRLADNTEAALGILDRHSQRASDQPGLAAFETPRADAASVHPRQQPRHQFSQP